jgi:DUF4097 and DUF4098 domain-containing protein YvlB
MQRAKALWPCFVVFLAACGAAQPKCKETSADAPVAVHAHAHERDGDHTTSRWRGRAHAVDVRAVRARVRVERSDGDTTEIAARTRASIEERDGTVFVQQHGAGAIDIRVPHGVAVRVTTVNGPIDARALDGEFDARTVSGPIKARVVGASDDKRVSLRTVSGPVLLDFADGASAHVRIDTVHGRHDGDEGRKETQIGEGGGDIRVSTVSGRVKIRKPHRHEDSDD